MQVQKNDKTNLCSLSSQKKNPMECQNDFLWIDGEMLVCGLYKFMTGKTKSGAWFDPLELCTCPPEI